MRTPTDSYVFYLFALLRQRPFERQSKLERLRSSPRTDNTMSALRFAEGYIKPKEVRQSTGNARKRASIRALGSITYLQKYYASGGTVREGLMLDDSKRSFVDSLSPRSGLMPPSIEVLLRDCHEDIQFVLEVWGIISYPSPSAHAVDGQEQTLDSPLSGDESDELHQLGHGKDLSYTSLNTGQQHRYDAVTIDMLTLLEASTKAISSIRTYSIHAPTLSLESLSAHRQAALAVIEMLSVLEYKSRFEDDDSESGYLNEYSYTRPSFGDLEEERTEMKKYLAVVQEQLFKPQAEKIRTQLEQLLIADPASNSAEGAALPKWILDEEWTPMGDNEASLDRCHSFLEFFGPDTRDPLPSPSSDLDGFLNALSDGYVMCMVFNAFVRLTNMPFGLVDKIHEDTTRTWRAVDNWRFLMQACKFRLEFKVSDNSFKPIEIVKCTKRGREQIQSWVRMVVHRGIQEAKGTLANKKPVSPIETSTIFPDF
ncbi:hypothetical protein BC939DRAFT_457932 [Gamsiella multidivaricata]|uniref:uncharacterized protein n=1 Tax=Gamsiella multidivaricata TaxID=101098 RepID=UPI00221E5ABC|nr:uncharacterized protein BC939DRAFT_457932 [Gamsiella multidivaricata]KAI7820424.1 hypothetical protein BC939DRAFT_457932 [Gamsiella multidivaricata]